MDEKLRTLIHIAHALDWDVTNAELTLEDHPDSLIYENELETAISQHDEAVLALIKYCKKMEI